MRIFVDKDHPQQRAWVMVDDHTGTFYSASERGLREGASGWSIRQIEARPERFIEVFAYPEWIRPLASMRVAEGL